MKDFHLRFYENRWFTDLTDLLQNDIDELVPETPGAYVLGSSDGTKFVYPWGDVPIFYIGKADDLWKRLSDHKLYTLKAIRDHEERYWWPRYQYGAAFGATVAWYSIKGNQNPNSLETDLIDQFYEMYGSIPVANGTWPSGARKPTHGSRDE